VFVAEERLLRGLGKEKTWCVIETWAKADRDISEYIYYTMQQGPREHYRIFKTKANTRIAQSTSPQAKGCASQKEQQITGKRQPDGK